MDSFRLCLAFGPVAIYLLLMGAINLTRRPFLVTGGREIAALAVAVLGLVIVGPIELFFPTSAAVRFGVYIWVLLLTLYALVVVLLLLTLRPRITVYNISLDELRPILADLVTQLDTDARWAGDSLMLPTLKVQLYLDPTVGMRNVSLIALGPEQDAAGWRRLEQGLIQALAGFEVPRNPRGYSFVVAGVITVALLTLAIARAPEAVTQSMAELLRL